MTPNKQLIELCKAFKKDVQAIADDTRFESFVVDGFLEQLSDDIFEMQQEANEEDLS